MLDTTTPLGRPLTIPERPDEDHPGFTSAACELARSFYDEQGYVVLRKLLPTDACAEVRAIFDADIRWSKVPILRQKTMQYERNVIDRDGFLSNPIFNVQDLGSRSLGRFRRAVLDLLTHPRVAAATREWLGGGPTKLIQSMFFEAPAGTWAHQDSYYQDSAEGLGGCVAGWFALEDIDAGAGRFYLCPGSHRSLSPLRNAGEYNFATGHATYQQAVLEAIRAHDLPIAAPYLAAGDVLFWNSLTIHGSLPASRPGVSRASLTAHYLRERDDMLQFHSRIRSQHTIRHNGMTVGLLHDQDRLHNRLIRDVAFHAPGPYKLARRLALRALLATRGLRRRSQR